jgi:hypothetical protein
VSKRVPSALSWKIRGNLAACVKRCNCYLAKKAGKLWKTETQGVRNSE